jgi:hypothetical protein
MRWWMVGGKGSLSRRVRRHERSRPLLELSGCGGGGGGGGGGGDAGGLLCHPQPLCMTRHVRSHRGNGDGKSGFGGAAGRRGEAAAGRSVRGSAGIVPRPVGGGSSQESSPDPRQQRAWQRAIGAALPRGWSGSPSPSRRRPPGLVWVGAGLPQRVSTSSPPRFRPAEFRPAECPPLHRGCGGRLLDRPCRMWRPTATRT